MKRDFHYWGKRGKHNHLKLEDMYSDRKNAQKKRAVQRVENTFPFFPTYNASIQKARPYAPRKDNHEQQNY
ncbi:MAG: hypothetical protein IJH98_07930 [Solobacterium sp.]|nr:hypothetical protein [Solobacterium sp.]